MVQFGPELMVHFTPELVVQFSPDYTVGYERSAVWDYPHVESRLLDYYHHSENKWEKLLRVKL